MLVTRQLKNKTLEEDVLSVTMMDNGSDRGCRAVKSQVDYEE